MSEKIEQLVAMRLNTYFKAQPMTPALTELKTELATDLNEAANDKVKAGQEPEAAVAEAFSDFGDINELIQQVNAENGTAQDLHGHHIVVDDAGVSIDDGKTLKINHDGVSINHGAIKADEHGLKIGKLVMDESGINYDGEPVMQPDFGDPVQPLNLAGEYQDNLRLVNEQRFAAAEIDDLSIAYRSATVKVLPTVGGEDEIIVREYMKPNNTAYYAHTSQQGSALSIEQGKVPFLIPLRVHVQIHVPASYTGDLKLASKSGSVLLAGLKQLQVVNLRITSGSCRVDNVAATAMSADIISGSLKLNQVTVTDQFGMLVKSGRIKLATVQAGQFTVNATSGSIQGADVTGSGSWTAHSGSIKLALKQLTGDVNLNAHSGSIKLAMPVDASYRYQLESHSGRVTSPAQAVKEHVADGYQAGYVGPTAQYLINGRAHSGSIKLY